MTSPLILPPQGIRTFPSPGSFVQRGTSPLNVLYTGAANQTALTTLSTTVDVLRAYPFVVGSGGVVDTIYVEATATVANAVGRVGIYTNTDDSTMYPATRLVDSGEVALATAVVRSSAVSVPLSPGLYWLASICGTANPTLRAINVGGQSHVMGLGSDLTTKSFLSVSLAYQALPATFTAGATPAAAGAVPAVGVHFA